jgi:hypothetical protein
MKDSPINPAPNKKHTPVDGSGVATGFVATKFAE